jgi:uncharacterized protein (TIGR02145 family)
MIKIIFISILFLLCVCANAQIWNIGSPNAAGVTATLNNDVLSIKGTGQMQSWSNSTLIPWRYSYATTIKYVEIEEGVTNIGVLAFCNVSINNLISIKMPESLQSIAMGAFFYSPITAIEIPKAVTQIGIQAFDGCTQLSSVTNHNPVPQSIFSTVFNAVNLSACTLTVPCGSLAAYQSAAVWKDFGTIVEDCPPPQAGVSNVKANFSCPGEVSVTYDLGTNVPADATLYYSPDGGSTWLTAQTVSGDLAAQTTGTGKTIVWDSRADHVRYGKFKLKVEVPKPEICDCTVKSTLPVGELTFLCYNLGAASNMSIQQQMNYTPFGKTDATVYGDLYQWGRPTDGHQKRTSAITSTLATSTVPGHDKFIAPGIVSPYDWYYWHGTSTLWSVPKAANDPCPQGYRIPTIAEMESIWQPASGNTWVWNSTGTPGYKVSSDGGSTFSLFLPAAGLRNTEGRLDYDNSGNDVGYTGRLGGYWTTTPISGSFYIFYVEENRPSPISYNGRANGYSCRCVKEY